MEQKKLNWRYYNHALLSDCAPHEEVNVERLKNKVVWNAFKPKQPLFACWTSNFDCGYNTGWWYCILDKPFDFASIKSKQRAELNKANRNFDVRIIDAKVYAKQMFQIHKVAWETYIKQKNSKQHKSIFAIK